MSRYVGLGQADEGTSFTVPEFENGLFETVCPDGLPPDITNGIVQPCSGTGLPSAAGITAWLKQNSTLVYIGAAGLVVMAFLKRRR